MVRPCVARGIVEVVHGLGVAVQDHVIAGRGGHPSLRGMRLI